MCIMADVCLWMSTDIFYVLILNIIICLIKPKDKVPLLENSNSKHHLLERHCILNLYKYEDSFFKFPFKSSLIILPPWVSP